VKGNNVKRTEEVHMSKRKMVLAGILLLCACVAGCSSDPPSVRILNARAEKVNVQFKFGADNTININDVEAGTATAYRDVSEGQCVVTVTIQSESVAPTTTFNTEKDFNYTVVVLTSTPPALRVDSFEK
jgi:hypothetical protein